MGYIGDIAHLLTLFNKFLGHPSISHKHHKIDPWIPKHLVTQSDDCLFGKLELDVLCSSFFMAEK